MSAGEGKLQPQSFVLLDGFRGLGAVIVLVGHILLVLGSVVIPGGAVIVDLFFLLSGFVVAFWYEPRFDAGMSFRQFMLQRFVRLYPLYLLGIVLGYAFLLAAAIGDEDGGARSWMLTLQLLPELFVLPAPEALGSPNAYPLNIPAWTLFFEFLVNIAYALAFRWLRRTWVLAVVTALCAGLLIATVLTIGGIDAGSDWATFWAGLGRAGFGFFAGVLAYRLLGRPSTARRPESRCALALLFAIPAACFLPAGPQLRPFVDLLMTVGLGIPLLFLAQSVEPPKRFARLFMMGGRISYAIYVLHWPFLEAATRLTWRNPDAPALTLVLGVAIVAIVLSAAYAAERYFDRPVRRWIVAGVKRRAAARPVTESRSPETRAAATFAE